MRFNIILFLLLSAICFGQYTNTNRAYVLVHSGGASTNGGGIDIDTDWATTWAYTDITAADGTPYADEANTQDGTQTANLVRNNTGNVQLQGGNGSAWYAGVTVGTIAWVDFAATYTTGRYRIISVDNSDDDITIALVYSADTTADCRVGGCINNLQNAADSFICASAVIEIRTGLNETIAAGIDIDTGYGVINYPLTFLSCDSSFDYSRRAVTITTTAAINELLDFDAASDYTKWRGFIFDGGDGATDATYCINDDVDGSTNHTFEDCEIRDATNSGVLARSTFWNFLACDIHDCGTYGIEVAASNRMNDLVVQGCNIYSNNNGIEVEGPRQKYIGNFIHSNTAAGLYINRYWTDATIMFNTIANNADGINTTSTAVGYPQVLAYNIFSDNSDHGIDANGYLPATYMDYNLYYNNTTAATDIVTDANINTGTIGRNNLTSDPAYTDGASDDYSLTASSPAIGAALGGLNIGAGNHTAGGSNPRTGIGAGILK